MIDVQAAAVITRFAQEIEKRALPLDMFPDNIPHREKREHETAWRLLSNLMRFMSHVKDSDLHLQLWKRARDDGNDKEQDRHYNIVRQEDRGYAVELGELEKLLREATKIEKKDPEAKKYGKEREANAKARAEMRAREAEEKRVSRNIRAKARRDAAKAEAEAVVAAAAKTSAPKKTTKKATAKA